MPIDAFAKLADPGFARDAFAVVGGYGAAAMGDVAVSSFTDTNVPSEAYGIATIVGAQYAPGVDGRVMRHVQLGGAGHTAIAAADRLGIREQVEEAL